MADDKEPKRGAQPEKHEPLLVPRVIRIGDQPRTIIEEHGRRLLERDAVLSPVGRGLAFIPLDRSSFTAGL